MAPSEIFIERSSTNAFGVALRVCHLSMFGRQIDRSTTLSMMTMMTMMTDSVSTRHTKHFISYAYKTSYILSGYTQIHFRGMQSASQFAELEESGALNSWLNGRWLIAPFNWRCQNANKIIHHHITSHKSLVTSHYCRSHQVE